MRRLDQWHLDHPVYGNRRLTQLLRREGQGINRKRVVRLLQLMGIEAIYPKGSSSRPGPGHRLYPYLLAGLDITGPDRCGAATSRISRCRGAFCFWMR